MAGLRIKLDTPVFMSQLGALTDKLSRRISMVLFVRNLIMHPYIVPYMFTYGHIQETVFIIDINNSHKRELK